MVEVCYVPDCKHLYNVEHDYQMLIVEIEHMQKLVHAASICMQCKSPDDKIPTNLQSAAITAVLLTIEAVLVILTTVILVLFFYCRKAPEIKATSPYLSLIMFLGCYSLLASGTIGAISPSVLHD